MRSAICRNTGKLSHPTRADALNDARRWPRHTVFWCTACASHHAAEVPRAKGEKSTEATESAS